MSSRVTGKITKEGASGNRAFRLAEVNQPKLKELSELLGITENAVINLAISDLWAAKRVGATSGAAKRAGI